MFYKLEMSWFHFVWGTRQLETKLKEELRKGLMKHLKTYCQKNEINLDTLSVMEEHIHLLVCVEGQQSASHIANLIKIESAKWINQRNPLNEIFSWQDGYGSFFVSSARLDEVRGFINNQEDYHKDNSFVGEIEKLLDVYELQE